MSVSPFFGTDDTVVTIIAGILLDRLLELIPNDAEYDRDEMHADTLTDLVNDHAPEHRIPAEVGIDDVIRLFPRAWTQAAAEAEVPGVSWETNEAPDPSDLCFRFGKLNAA